MKTFITCGQEADLCCLACGAFYTWNFYFSLKSYLIKSVVSKILFICGFIALLLLYVCGWQLVYGLWVAVIYLFLFISTACLGGFLHKQSVRPMKQIIWKKSASLQSLCPELRQESDQNQAKWNSS